MSLSSALCPAILHSAPQRQPPIPAPCPAPTDLLLNWDTVGAPVVRLLVMLAMVGISIAVEYMELPYMSIG